MSLTTFADNPERLLLALLLATAVSLLARRARALTTGGAAAAILVGCASVAGAGWWCGGAITLFFVTSTALSTLRVAKSSEVRQQRGHRRDAVQVLANGGIPALLSLIGWATTADYWTIGTLCAIAAATADTWATEIGRLTQWIPRSLVNGARVPVGTSGAISLPGTVASLIGSAVIAAFAAIGIANDWLDGRVGTAASFAVIAFAGIAGSLLDSLVGATIQESYYCDSCGKVTELSRHDCGSTTRKLSGVTGFNNDVVNLIGSGLPALVAVFVLATTV